MLVQTDRSRDGTDEATSRNVSSSSCCRGIRQVLVHHALEIYFEAIFLGVPGNVLGGERIIREALPRQCQGLIIDVYVYGFIVEGYEGM